MHGAGNDFIVLDNRNHQLALHGEMIRAMADRHFGIGADQVLVVEQPDQMANDFKYRIFNADGHEVQQCGNGARCFVQYIVEKGLSTKKKIRVETLAGIIEPELIESNWVRVNMGPPRFEPESLPFISDGLPVRMAGQMKQYGLQLNASGPELLWVSVVSMGNPHVVIALDEPASDALVSSLGPLLESHPRFPERVNVGFLSVIDKQKAHLRVYERGSGETLACGTGACAAAVAGIQMGLLANRVTMIKKGGELSIDWSVDQSDVLMTGPAKTVFDGDYWL